VARGRWSTRTHRGGQGSDARRARSVERPHRAVPVMADSFAVEPTGRGVHRGRACGGRLGPRGRCPGASPQQRSLVTRPRPRRNAPFAGDSSRGRRPRSPTVRGNRLARVRRPWPVADPASRRAEIGPSAALGRALWSTRRQRVSEKYGVPRSNLGSDGASRAGGSMRDPSRTTRETVRGCLAHKMDARGARPMRFRDRSEGSRGAIRTCHVGSRGANPTGSLARPCLNTQR
jgi:hypothetical protein